MSILEGKVGNEDDFDRFLKDISVQRQSFDTDNATVVQEEPGMMQEPIFPTKEKQAEIAGMREFSKFSSSLIINSFDSIFRGVGGLVSRAENTDMFGADPEEKEAAVDACANYLKDKGGDLPPGMLLLMVMSSIYGPKVPLMFAVRKVEQEKEYLRKQVEISNAMIEDQKKQIEQLSENKNVTEG